MNLDISSRYFRIEPEFLHITLPASCTPIALAEMEQYLQPKLAEAVNTGINKVIINVNAIRYLDMSALKYLVQTMQACRGLGMSYALIGNTLVASECKNLEETKFWDFHETVENAKAHLVSGGQLVKA